MRKNYRIIITGLVQGVGFRPFLYNLAVKTGLSGKVSNTSHGVNVEVEGEELQIRKFIEEIKENPPPLAYIQETKIQEQAPVGYSGFHIIESDGNEERKTLISPDTAICGDCLAELMDPADRRYMYPFINCTNCGPRFTIIEDIPYDRPNTTMKHFPMCDGCRGEYENPADRRFHAQPNACPECGPRVLLYGPDKQKIITNSPIKKAAKLLAGGKIIAVKGIGGYHLACDAKNNKTVKELRFRKYREDKPFAVMFSGIEAIKDYCYVNDEERALLISIKRPIVLLRKKKEAAGLAIEIAPENDFLGVMLPYAPIHYILFNYFHGPLVMTSANVSDEPIAFRDGDALERLTGIADYFLVHNREIRHRYDDSVSRIFRGHEYLIRRSRGYAPAPIVLNRNMKRILACGGEQKNTFCLTKDKFAFISHHIGDLENLETLEAFTGGIESYKKLFEIEPEIIAYDLHPEYLSTKYALEIPGIKKVGVQHHHAHIVSCMAENHLQDPVIGVAFDGTGFGTDGHIWGGEFLVAGYTDFERVAHLQYRALPGGAMAIKEPWRMAASYLFGLLDIEDLSCLKLEFVKNTDPDKLLMLKDMVDKKINSPLTSGMGRLFDAVSALLNIKTHVNYEGQGAVELEQRARYCRDKRGPLLYKYDILSHANSLEIDPGKIIQGLIGDIELGLDVEKAALKFHYTIADMVIKVCGLIRDYTGISQVCLSGGVFQNLLLLEKTLEGLTENGFKTYIHRQVPPNDGGISLGQCVIANEKELTRS